jgi:hypothetical protein
MKKELAIKDIVVDRRFQSRSGGLKDDHLGELLLAYEGSNGDLVECPRVFEIVGKSGYWLTQGFHRIECLKRLGKTKVMVEVKKGTWADAILDAATGNFGHGLRRTNKDKRRCVEMILGVHADWSSQLIADKAAVGDDLVEDVRTQLSESESSETENTKKPRKRVGRDGKARSLPEKNDSAPTPAPKGSKKAQKHQDDDVPDLPGVYRPLFMLNENGHQVALDGHSNSVPDGVGDVFADPTIRSILADAVAASEQFEKLLRRVGEMKRRNHFPYAEIPEMEKLAGLVRDNAILFVNHIREAVPYLCCPQCHGTKCHFCRGSGYLSKGMYDSHPEFEGRKRG